MFGFNGHESTGSSVGPWMALPLFNREGSPDESREVLSWNEPEEVQMDDVLTSDLDPYYLEYSEPSTTSFGSPISLELFDDPCLYDIDLAYCTTGETTSAPNSTGPISGAAESTDSSCYNQAFDDDNASTCSHLDLPPDLIPDHLSQYSSGDSSPALQSSAPTTCPYPGCKSTAHFSTPRDFRRHYRQHFKRFFCRHEECPQSVKDPENAGKRGFATRKDRARHEAKHNPEIKCQWKGRNGETCSRVFSRMDNMRDHVRRIHGRKL